MYIPTVDVMDGEYHHWLIHLNAGADGSPPRVEAYADGGDQVSLSGGCPSDNHDDGTYTPPRIPR